MSEANNAAVEQEAPEAKPEADVVDLHPSITDMLSHDPSADALGGLNVGLDDETGDKPAEATATEEKDEKETVETSTTEKAKPPEDWEAQLAAFKQTALDERSKRQNLETTIQANQAPAEKADLFEDPDKRLQQELDPIEQRFNNRLIAMSEAQAKGRHEDFDEKYQAFATVAQSDPGLVAKAIGSVDPGEFVYQEGKRLMLTQELGDGGLETMRDKIRAEEAAKLEETIKTRVKEQLDKIGKLPPSSADLTGKNTRQKPIDTDLSLTDILKR